MKAVRGLSLAVATVIVCFASTVSDPPRLTLAAPTPLTVSQDTGFVVLGHWCGGIREKAYASRFGSGAGYPNGFVYLWTICSAGGKGGHSVTFSAWITATWDFTGALATYAPLKGAPSYNPNLSVYDAHGNHLYNQSAETYLSLAKGFVPPPRVAGVSPTSSPQGTVVTITGTSFTGATSVHFGPKPASKVTVVSATSITTVAPAVRAGTVNVTVTSHAGTSPKNTNDRFTFTLTPRIGSISPNTGGADGGTRVTISGVNFTGANGVRFDGLPATYKVESDTTIVATSPPGPDSGVAGYVTVTSAYGTSATGPSTQFTWGD